MEGSNKPSVMGERRVSIEKSIVNRFAGKYIPSIP